MAIRNSPGSRRQKLWNEGLFESQECPVCSKLPRYPSYECELGHIICCYCLDCIECPLCDLACRDLCKNLNNDKKETQDIENMEYRTEPVKDVEDNSKETKLEKTVTPKVKQEKVRKQQRSKKSSNALIQTEHEFEKSVEDTLNVLRESIQNSSNDTDGIKLKKMMPKKLKEPLINLIKQGKLNAPKESTLNEYSRCALEKGKVNENKDKKLKKSLAKTETPKTKTKIKSTQRSLQSQLKDDDSVQKLGGVKESGDEPYKIPTDKVLAPPVLVVVRSEATLTNFEAIENEEIIEIENPLQLSYALQEIKDKSLVRLTNRESNQEQEYNEIRFLLPNVTYRELSFSYPEPVFAPHNSISTSQSQSQYPLNSEFVKSNVAIVSPEIINADESLCDVPKDQKNSIFQELHPSKFDLNANYINSCLYEQLANAFELMTDQKLVEKLNNTSQLLEESDYKFSKDVTNRAPEDLNTIQIQNAISDVLNVGQLSEIQVHYEGDYTAGKDLVHSANSIESISSNSSQIKRDLQEELIIAHLNYSQALNEMDLETSDVLKQTETFITTELITNNDSIDLFEKHLKMSETMLEEESFVQEQAFLKKGEIKECIGREISGKTSVETIMKLWVEEISENDLNVCTKDLREEIVEAPPEEVSENLGEISLEEKEETQPVKVSEDKCKISSAETFETLVKVSEILAEILPVELLEPSRGNVSEGAGEISLEEEMEAPPVIVSDNINEISSDEIAETSPVKVSENLGEISSPDILETPAVKVSENSDNINEISFHEIVETSPVKVSENLGEISLEEKEETQPVKVSEDKCEISLAETLETLVKVSEILTDILPVELLETSRGNVSEGAGEISLEEEMEAPLVIVSDNINEISSDEIMETSPVKVSENLGEISSPDILETPAVKVSENSGEISSPDILETPAVKVSENSGEIASLNILETPAVKVSESLGISSPGEVETPLIVVSEIMCEISPDEIMETTSVKVLENFGESFPEKTAEQPHEKVLENTHEISSPEDYDSETVGDREVTVKTSERLLEFSENLEEITNGEISEKDSDYVIKSSLSWIENKDSVLSMLNKLLDKVEDKMREQCDGLVVMSDEVPTTPSELAFTANKILELCNEINRISSSVDVQEYKSKNEFDLNNNQIVDENSIETTEKTIQVKINEENNIEDNLLLKTESKKICVATVDKILKRGDQYWTLVSNNEGFPEETNVPIFVAEKIKFGNECKSPTSLTEFPNVASADAVQESHVPILPLFIHYLPDSYTEKRKLESIGYPFSRVTTTRITRFAEEGKQVIPCVSVGTEMNDQTEQACQVGISLAALEETSNQVGVCNTNLQTRTPSGECLTVSEKNSDNYVADFTQNCVDEMLETFVNSFESVFIAAQRGVNSVIAAHQDIGFDDDLTNSYPSIVTTDIFGPGETEVEENYFDANEG